ncbi:MAG TPA: hypothetical protein VGD78_01275 [Chthoniobacterales bacterium]
MAVEPVAFAGWPNNLCVSNDTVELILTLDVGPRIMSFRRAGGQNVFKVRLDEAGGTGESVFKLRGGHRLWRAPEDYGTEHSLTYVIDNDRIDHKVVDEFSVSVAHVAAAPHRLRREVCVHVSQSGPTVTVEHTLQNDGPAPLSGSAWGLSVMAAGGFAVIPQPALGTHPQDFVPNRRWVLWPFTDLPDERFRVSPRLLRLYQTNRKPFKLGLQHRERWVGYVLGDDLFLKTIPFLAGEEYPDEGSNFETFTNWDFLELESIGPYRTLEPGASLQHTERWALFADVNLPDPQDEDAFLATLEDYAQQLF